MVDFLRDYGVYPVYSRMIDWLEGGEAVSYHDQNDGTSPVWRHAANRHWRDAWINRAGFSLPNKEAIEKIAALGSIVEIGAGSGYIARLLSRVNSNVIATDIGEKDWPFTPAEWFDVKEMSAEDAIGRHRGAAIVLSWPYMESWAGDAIRLLEPGQKFVYIGTQRDECCARDNFFDVLEEDFDQVEELDWMTFEGHHDGCWIYQKK